MPERKIIKLERLVHGTGNDRWSSGPEAAREVRPSHENPILSH